MDAVDVFECEGEGTGAENACAAGDEDEALDVEPTIDSILAI